MIYIYIYIIYIIYPPFRVPPHDRTSVPRMETFTVNNNDNNNIRLVILITSINNTTTYYYY